MPADLDSSLPIMAINGRLLRFARYSPVDRSILCLRSLGMCTK